MYVNIQSEETRTSEAVDHFLFEVQHSHSVKKTLYLKPDNWDHVPNNYKYIYIFGHQHSSLFPAFIQSQLLSFFP